MFFFLVLAHNIINSHQAHYSLLESAPGTLSLWQPFFLSCYFPSCCDLKTLFVHQITLYNPQLFYSLILMPQLLCYLLISHLHAVNVYKIPAQLPPFCQTSSIFTPNILHNYLISALLLMAT